jgi:hypothetical protein
MLAAVVAVVLVELHPEEQVAVVLEQRVVLLSQLRELPIWVAAAVVEQVTTPHIRPAKLAAKASSLLNGDSSNGVLCRIR